MDLNIIYTEDALDTLNSIYHFIKLRFGQRIADTFLDKAEKTVTLIAANPFMFKSTHLGTNIRQGLITAQTSIFYKVDDTHILLMYFWDNRQEPQFS